MIQLTTTHHQHRQLFTKITALIFFLFLLSAARSGFAQVIYTETFDIGFSTTSLPLGWSSGKIGAGSDPENYWDRVTIGTNPTASPMGTAMMRYQSFNIIAGEASYLASKRFAMNGTGAQSMPPGGAPFHFQFWRDNSGVYSATADRIQVYLNTSPDMGGAPTLLNEINTSSGVIHRSNSLTPSTPSTGWVTYNYLIPNSAPWSNSTALYVIIVATSEDGNNMFLDNFSMTSYPAVQTFGGVATAQVFSQNTFNTGINQINQQVIGCKFTMNGAFNPKTLTNMEFNTNGSTNPSTDITNAKLWFTGGSPQFDINTAIPLGTCTGPVIYATNYMFLKVNGGGYTGPTSFSGLEHGENYFWITYNIAPGATPLNCVDAEWIGFTLALPTTNYVPSVQTLPGCRMIDLPYCIPYYTVGTSGGPWSQNYTAGDYIAGVSVTGGALPDLSNTMNWILQQPSPTASAGCNVGPYPKDCPYQLHGPDYELFQETNHPGYTLGRSTTKTFTADGTTVYSIGLTAGSWYGGNYIAAFIDYNKDGDFVDAGEKIAQSGAMAGNSTFTQNFTVPVNATLGKTRLRVRAVYANSNIQPCNAATWGETEDYVVTIVPTCASYPGYTTWLGLTDDWSDPANWCPPTAPLSTNPLANVRLPGSASGTYNYVRPKIKSGVNARAQKLRIEVNDTLFIDAYSGSSMTVTDSLKIETSSSALIVNTAFVDTAQIYNGTLNRPTDNPLSNSLRSRSFLAFTQADMIAQGVVAGDAIIKILMHLQRKNNGNPYKNLQVKMYYASTMPFGTGSSAAVPVPIGPKTTVYSGDVDVDTYIPGAGAFGTVDLELTTPFAWNGSTNNLIVEICYDNTGFPGTGISDEIRFTQTTSLRRYLNLEALSTFPKAGCDLSPQDTVFIPCTFTAGSNTVTIVDPAAAGKIYPGQLVVGGGISGLQVVSVAGTTITLSGNAFASGTNIMVNFYNVNTIGIFYRPNLTFQFSRPYVKYPIAVGGHWENNGTFEPAESRVIMNGTIPNQKIDGVSSTTFFDLNIQNPNHVILYKDFRVTDSLRLVNGRLKLNNGMVTLTNQLPSALTYVPNAGDLQAETDVTTNNLTPFGRLTWDMGSAPGLRTIPFINASGTRIPLDYNIDSGTHNVTLGTYATQPDNTNLPLPEVTDIYGETNGVGGTPGSAGWTMVDRYYLVDNTSAVSAQADITFRFATTELPPAGNILLRAQRWINASDLWEFPFQPGQVNPTMQSVLLTDYNGFSAATWWTIVKDPLGNAFYNEKTQCWNMLLSGNEYTVGINNMNSLWTWGNNTSGQLGDGTNTSRNYPALIGPAGSWQQAAVCLDHTLAVKNDGTLWAWGNNLSGQLGDGTVVSKNQPVQIGTGTNWRTVTAGENFSLGIRTDGTLWAWGNNTFGQLGTGNNVNYNAPVQVGSGTDWLMISAGSSHVLAIKSNGTLWAWGFNGDGALGNGSLVNSNSPQQIGTDVNWSVVSGGNSHSLALKNTGTLWSWGLNSDGQLGNGTTISTNTPGQIGTAVNWDRISNGWLHNHAIKTDGSLWSWGNNQSGQLGDNTTINKTSPVQIAAASSWQTVAAGAVNSFGIKDDGSLWCWGSNVSGQFGNETNTGSNIPVKNSYFSDFIPADSIVSCASTVDINAGSGYDAYLWSSGQTTQTITVATNGWYICTVTKISCLSTDSIYVSFSGAAAYDTTYSVESCPGTDYTLPSGQIVDTSGTYVSQFTNAAGCDSIITVNLSFVDLIVPTVVNCPADFSSCNPVTWTPPQFSDNCAITVTSNFQPGANLPPGVNTITYTAVDSGFNSVSCSFDVTIIETAIAPDSITSNRNNNNICLGGSIILTVNGGNPGFQGTWNWYTGSCGGNLLSAFTGMSSITVSPTTTTTYYARAENMCSITACAEITVIVSTSTPSNIMFTSLPNFGYAGGTGIATCSPSAGALFYLWRTQGQSSAVLFNGAVGPVETPVNTVNLLFQVQQQNYIIRVFAGNACGRSNNITAHIPGTIQAATCLDGPDLVCPSQTATYSVSNCPIPNASTYQWVLQPANAGTILSGQGSTTISVQFAPGFTGADVCVNGVTVFGLPGPQTCLTVTANILAPGMITGNADPCEGATESYSVAPVTGATSYIWTTNIAGAIISGTTETCTVQFPANPFTGQVCVQAVTVCGTSVATCLTVNSVIPAVAGTITGPVTGICGVSNVNYFLTTSNAISYNWILPPGVILNSSGNTNTINVNFSPGLVGPQTISVEAFYICNSTLSSIVVDGTPVIPSVTPTTICPGMDQLYVATSNGVGLTFTWTPVGEDFAFCSNFNCSNYYVSWLITAGSLSVTANNSCGTSPPLTMTTNCRIRNEESEFRIFPNPATDWITIEFISMESSQQSLILKNLLGQTIIRKDIDIVSGYNQHIMNLENVTPGMYILYFRDASGNNFENKITVE